MARSTTGVFYHPSFSRRSYLTVGRRLGDFPGALGGILERGNVLLCEPSLRNRLDGGRACVDGPEDPDGKA